MTAKISTIDGRIAAQAQEPNQELIDILEERLAEAKDGKLQYGVFIGVSSQLEVEYFTIGNDIPARLQLLGALAEVQHSLVMGGIEEYQE